VARRKIKEAMPVWLVEGDGTEPPDVDIAAYTAPRVPSTPANVVAVDDNNNHQITAADMVAGQVYELVVVPDVLTNTIRGVIKCAAVAEVIEDLEDGMPVVSHSPERICLPTGSTKKRIHFMRDSTTSHACKVYLTRTDA
jgi:hypothetical protein